MNERFYTDTSVFPVGSDAAVSRRAYEIWESEGRPDGCDLRHWLQAEQELGLNRSGASTLTEASLTIPDRVAGAPGPITPSTDLRSSLPSSRTTAPNRDGKRVSNPPTNPGRNRSSNGTSQSSRRKP